MKKIVLVVLPVVLGAGIFAVVAMYANRPKRHLLYFGAIQSVSFSVPSRSIHMYRGDIGAPLMLFDSRNGPGLPGCFLENSIHELAVSAEHPLTKSEVAELARDGERGTLSIAGTGAYVEWKVILTVNAPPGLVVLDDGNAYALTLTKPLTRYLRRGCAAN